ncbi:hypothetical protein ACFFX1_05790 [Dactylosporangium sucinum]|uniref:Uncharacterized protein n=1 Tax=Dactylosporangium sucinum TaxID=1424081 RepID=A0A917X7U8_9ACTN|nr:hypothetical protein [Dactylosporangium sucinum]GGM87386.1 hypothetical protein GCM10007977_106670 [Dactylosporangium sucinum]
MTLESTSGVGARPSVAECADGVQLITYIDVDDRHAAGRALPGRRLRRPDHLAVVIQRREGVLRPHPAISGATGSTSSTAWRADALGTYRFWRDVGHAAGALVAGAAGYAVRMRRVPDARWFS